MLFDQLFDQGDLPGAAYGHGAVVMDQADGTGAARPFDHFDRFEPSEEVTRIAWITI